MDDDAVAVTQAGPANWYGPYSDGCYYYWDGYTFTGEKDCSQSTYQFAAAGWYGPFSDGCNYWWDGAAYTGEKDCPQQTWAAGWYAHQDGCQWYYDGTQYTGQSSCPGGQVAGAGTTSMATGAEAAPVATVNCTSSGCTTTVAAGAEGNTDIMCDLGLHSCTNTIVGPPAEGTINSALLDLTALIHAQGGGDHAICQLLHAEPDANGDGRPDERDEYCRERYG